jgi:hypothetical protein
VIKNAMQITHYPILHHLPILAFANPCNNGTGSSDTKYFTILNSVSTHSLGREEDKKKHRASLGILPGKV